jgi:hypothetical protein
MMCIDGQYAGYDEHDDDRDKMHSHHLLLLSEGSLQAKQTRLSLRSPTLWDGRAAVVVRLSLWGSGPFD